MTVWPTDLETQLVKVLVHLRIKPFTGGESPHKENRLRKYLVGV